MRTKKDTLLIISALEKAYPESICGLSYENAWQLLVSVRLSAQCTDKRVNMITPILFEKFPTLEALSCASLEEISEIIKPCGFYNSKANDIFKASKMLLTNFNGVVPDNMDELLSIPGVGRKSANLILGDIYHQPAVVTDTHCIRLSNRLGFIASTDPYKVELALKKVLPPQQSNDFCHRLVLHGRAVCTSRGPKCEICQLADLCPKKL